MRAVASTFIALATLAIVTIARADAPTFNIGTGAAGGNYYSVGGALCRMVNRNDAMRCLTQQTSGSIDNLYALDLGDIDFAIMQGDVQAAAYAGSDRIADSPYRDLRSVFVLYMEMLTVVVRAGSGIETFYDLRGRRVNGGTSSSGTTWTFEAALNAHGIDTDELATLESSGAMEAAQDLCVGDVDALAIVSGHPSASLTRIADTCNIAILPMEPRVIATMSAMENGYVAVNIPGDLYPTIARPIATIGTMAKVVTLRSTHDALIEGLMEGVFADVEVFRQQQIVLGPNSPWRDALDAPLHPVAKRFFDRRAGVP